MLLLDHILCNTKKGERIYTGFLGPKKMYMPINLINELREPGQIVTLENNGKIADDIYAFLYLGKSQLFFVKL